MKKSLLVTVLVSLVVASCAKVPLTGRSQLSIIPDSEMYSMSFQQYEEFMNANPVSTDNEKTASVKRIGAGIQKAVEDYFAQEGLSRELRDYRWEFNLVESEDVNAWCMPGGKVVVYSGLLPVAETDAGLAVVMGHEIAHAVAEHGNERMSQALIAQMGGLALSAALENDSDQTQALWMTAFGVGAQFGVLLPFSRTQESEADHLGLIFMAMAGYDPRESVGFWQRMSAGKEGQGPPEFMSTHPSDQTRMDNLNKLIPEAMEYYNKAS